MDLELFKWVLMSVTQESSDADFHFKVHFQITLV